MAGDWIKIEENMPDKPEVWQIAALLKLDGDTVAGKLVRVWAWASRNCNGDGVTSVAVLPLLDRCAGVSGFAAAMQKVGWLLFNDTQATFPHFDRHCSQTAKGRANANRRVSKHRDSCNGDTVTDVTPAPLQKPLPEKRREQKRYNTRASERETGRTMPETLDTAVFRAAWERWLIHWSDAYGNGRSMPNATADVHLGACAKLGAAEAIEAIENAIARSLREPTPKFESKHGKTAAPARNLTQIEVPSNEHPAFT